jgi:hypothetical protein
MTSPAYKLLITPERSIGFLIESSNFTQLLLSLLSSRQLPDEIVLALNVLTQVIIYLVNLINHSVNIGLGCEPLVTRDAVVLLQSF